MKRFSDTAFSGKMEDLSVVLDRAYDENHLHVGTSSERFAQKKQIEEDRGVLVSAPPCDLEELRRAIHAGQDASTVAMRDLYAFRE